MNLEKDFEKTDGDNFNCEPNHIFPSLDIETLYPAQQTCLRQMFFQMKGFWSNKSLALHNKIHIKQTPKRSHILDTQYKESPEPQRSKIDITQ